MKNIRIWRIFWVYLSRSQNKRISCWIKKNKLFGIFLKTHLSKSLIWYIFLSIILLLRTLFSGISLVPYENFVLHLFSQKRTFLTQKLLYFFKMVKFNLIFLFLVTYGSFTPVCAREDTAPSQFLILIFDHFWLFD